VRRLDGGVRDPPPPAWLHSQAGGSEALVSASAQVFQTILANAQPNMDGLTGSRLSHFEEVQRLVGDLLRTTVETI